ncbi:8-oxo-dGTP diphosphatase [Arthrobacter sp. D2-10]
MTPRRVALCFLFRQTTAGREVLLGMKRSGFGTGRIVALGGGIEPGESAGEAAAREVHEESGVVVKVADLVELGPVRWRFPVKPVLDMDAVVFTTERFSGHPAVTDEIDPCWYPVEQVPWDGMWDDAKHWLGHVLHSQPLNVTVTLNPDNETVATADFD